MNSSQEVLQIPFFPGKLRKNDALFLYGASQSNSPFVFSYCQNTTEVVHGPSCKVPEEIHTENCLKDHVEIIERRGGGGTVVLSSGMCVTIVVGPRNEMNALQIFRHIHTKMIELLSLNGITGIEQKGISDLAIDGKKIMGSSLYMGTKPPIFYYQSSLMVCSDISLISCYLKHPPKEPDYRSGRSHETFCTTLSLQGYKIKPDSVCSVFNNQLANFL